MSDLAEFLLARIAEDEAVARKATPGPWEWDRTPGREWGHQPPDLVTVAKEPPYSDGSVSPAGYVISSWGHDADGVEVSDEDADHIARWNPARLFAECEAKRRIVVRCSEMLTAAVPMAVHLAQQTLTDLGRPHADHPDYREEWRP